MDDSTRSSGLGEDRESSQSGQTGATGRWGSWMQDYESGNYDNLPHDEIIRNYRDWSASAQPDQVHEATSYGYQRVPQEQWRTAAQGLSGYSQRRNMDLSDLGLSSTDVEQWNSEDLARVTSRTYSNWQEEEEEEGMGIAKPVAALALAGALAYAASRFMGSGEE